MKKNMKQIMQSVFFFIVTLLQDTNKASFSFDVTLPVELHTF